MYLCSCSCSVYISVGIQYLKYNYIKQYEIRYNNFIPLKKSKTLKYDHYFYISKTVASANSFGIYSYHASPGTYQIECWGASGAEDRNNGGLGGYVSGIITFKHFTPLFIYVGERGKRNSNKRTFNGGGSCTSFDPSRPEGK